MAFADWNFYIYATPEKQEVSRFDTLTQVYKSTGKKPNALKAPQLIDEAVITWELFLYLPVVSMAEIQAYSQLTGESISPWQVEALLKMNKLRNHDYSKGRR